MGCSNCGTGKPSGCKSNGGCSTGSCNRMNVHDWLMNLPFSDPESNCKIVEVSFSNGSRKDFYRNATLQFFEKGELVSVEGTSGFDVGEVSLSGELVRLQMKKKGVNELSSEIKKILRRSTELDISKWQENKEREKEMLVRSRAMSRVLKLQMKLSEVEIQADGRKATFFYTADDRVDFRELIRQFANDFKVKVEMRQIGARQEAGKVGGIGSCGRELCCATWLTDFKSVNTTAARYQNLSINQTKLSGQCGRLKCCLNYELDTYLDALQHFPDNADVIQITRSPAYLVKKDIFKNLMWYSVPDSVKHYPLTIARVKEIQRLNAAGQKPDELEAVEIVSSKIKEVEPEFVDVVGQISLRSLERNSKRRKDKSRASAQQNERKDSQSAGGSQQGRGNQSAGGGQQGRVNQSAGGSQQARGNQSAGGSQQARSNQSSGGGQQVRGNQSAGGGQRGRGNQSAGGGQQARGNQPQRQNQPQQRNPPQPKGNEPDTGESSQGSQQRGNRPPGGQQRPPQQNQRQNRPPQTPPDKEPPPTS